MDKPHDSTVRAIPKQNWSVVLIAMLVICGLATAGWEWKARAESYPTGYYANSDGLWGIQRRAISRMQHPVVIIGSSRTYFDLDLNTWEEVTGQRPVQLSFEGTDPRPFLADLAADPQFDGTVIVGTTPPLFFTGYAFRAGVDKSYKDETPAERFSQRLSMLLEPRVAFYGSGRSNLSLFTWFKQRIPFGNREGVFDPFMDVPGFEIHDSDRNTQMWSRTWEDPVFNKRIRDAWLYFFSHQPPPPDMPQLTADEIFAAVQGDVAKIRARGGDVVFLRCPSIPPFRDIEAEAFPRAAYWDRLSANVDAGTIHFEDNPSLQGFEPPEWSHIRADQRPAFTRAVIPLVDMALKTRKPIVTMAATENGL